MVPYPVRAADPRVLRWESRQMIRVNEVNDDRTACELGVNADRVELEP